MSEKRNKRYFGTDGIRGKVGEVLVFQVICLSRHCRRDYQLQALIFVF